MKTTKRKLKKPANAVSVWLDHSGAKLFFPEGMPEREKIILSGFESRVRIPGESADGTRLGGYRVTNNEAHKHNREKDQLRVFYKQLAAELAPFDEIAISGPATASNELFNFLTGQVRFKEKKVFLRKGRPGTRNDVLGA